MVSFLVLLIIFAFILFVCIGRTFVHQELIAIPLRKLLFTVILPLVSNVLLALIPNKIVGEIAYCGYFVGTDWLLLYMINFSLDFCDSKLRQRPVMGAIILLGLVDTVSIFLNPIFHHVIALNPIQIEGSLAIYNSYISNVGHIVHLVYTYLLVAYLILIFAVKIHFVSRLYLEKYLVVFACVIVVAFWELFYIISRMPVDHSMLSYAGGAILVYFFSLEYRPFFLTDKMLSKVVSDISDAIFFMDDHENCIYFNKSACMLFHLEEGDFSGAAQEVGKLGEGEDFGTEAFSVIKKFPHTGGEVTYEIEYHQVYDKRKVYAGSFISVRDKTEEVLRTQRERYIATHDELTGLYNHDRFLQAARMLLDSNSDREYMLVCSDITEFKSVNDTFGEAVGDKILRNIAEILKYYAMDGSVYGRIGGDKFAVIMPKYRYSEELFIFGTKKLAHFDDEIFYPVSIHIGVYEVTERELPVSIMIDRAFMAISSIKDDPQNNIGYYTDAMRDSFMWEKQITAQLDPALEKGYIIPYLQAQVNHDGKVEGAELLCRWDHTPEGIITPSNFLQILERNGTIVKLDHFMWESACKILQKWEAEGYGSFYLSVNISPKDFFFIDVYETITSLTKKYNVSPSRLRLEITETVMMTDIKRNLNVIENLRNAGFVVEMDDFGSGYSSLNMLKDLPVDVLKIDMLFLENTRNSERAKTILQYIIAMSKELNIPVITEGVETTEQLSFLKSIGCDMFQGFYFSRPITLQSFEETFFA